MPIRVELGPRDVKQGTLVAVRRDTGEKSTLKMISPSEGLKDMLKNIQDSLFAK